MIKESRDRMTKACTADQWSDSLRACLVVGGNDECFAAAGQEASWGFPAVGVVISSGIAECDAYMAEILRLSQCKSMPQESRDALKTAYQQVGTQWSNVAADARAQVAAACKSGLEAMKQAGQSMCP
jgi:hypothetical protein